MCKDPEVGETWCIKGTEGRLANIIHENCIWDETGCRDTNQEGHKSCSGRSNCILDQDGNNEAKGRRQWHPTPVLLPGESHGRRSLAGYSPWGHKESDTTERLHFRFSRSCTGEGNGNLLQYSCLENPRDRSLVGCCLWGRTESDTTDVTQQQQQSHKLIHMHSRLLSLPPFFSSSLSHFLDLSPSSPRLFHSMYILLVLFLQRTLSKIFIIPQGRLHFMRLKLKF